MNQLLMNEPTRNCASHLFQALSNPARLRIVELLSQPDIQAMTVNEISAALDLGQSATSQNLAMLAQVGRLMVEQKGVFRYYRTKGPRTGHILDLIEKFCHVHELYGIAQEE